MSSIIISMNVKPFDQLSDSEIVQLSENMNRSKADLLVFTHYFGNGYSYQLLNDYISDQEDVETFVRDYFSGNLDGLQDDAEHFVADRYAEVI